MAKPTLVVPTNDQTPLYTGDGAPDGERGESARSLLTKMTTALADLYTGGVPHAQYTTAALQSATMTGPQVAGAPIVVFDNTGTTPGNLQFPTAAAVVAAIPGAQAGFAYLLKIRNSSGSANTATITTNTGITLTGTMTIAQFAQREFVVTLNSLTAVTVQSVGLTTPAAA